MGFLRYLARTLPGFFDRFLQVAEFVQQVWRATDGGLKQLSPRYKTRRPGITPYRQIAPYQAKQAGSPPPYRAITSGLYNPSTSRDLGMDDDDDDDITDEDRTFFYSVKHRRPYSDYELRKWLREVQD